VQRIRLSGILDQAPDEGALRPVVVQGRADQIEDDLFGPVDAVAFDQVKNPERHVRSTTGWSAGNERGERTGS
jgi:hypothetical protein